MEITRLTADVVLLAPSRLVLLIQRGADPYKGRWALPGGHVDDGELTDVAARRELAEETGIVVNDLELVGVYAEPGRDPRGRYVTFAYTALSLIDGACDPRAGDDAADARWWPISELTPDMLAFDHYVIITDTVEARRERYARAT